MLGKLSILFLLVAFTYGGVLRPAETDQEEECVELYVNCTSHEQCCDFMRCMDFGEGKQCLFGTDNPQIHRPGNAIQPPVDLIDNLGCSLYGEKCEVLEDCCAPYVCSSKGTCDEPYVDPYGFGVPGFGIPGYPGK